MIYNGHMSAFVISLLVAVGAAAFAWSKLEHGTGNADPKVTYLAAGCAGAFVFVVVYVTLAWVVHLG